MPSSPIISSRTERYVPYLHHRLSRCVRATHPVKKIKNLHMRENSVVILWSYRQDHTSFECCIISFFSVQISCFPRRFSLLKARKGYYLKKPVHAFRENVRRWTFDIFKPSQQKTWSYQTTHVYHPSICYSDIFLSNSMTHLLYITSTP